MPRRLTIDHPTTPQEGPNAGPLRRLWRHFLVIMLDRQALQRLSPHELRDIGLSDHATRDRFRDLQ